LTPFCFFLKRIMVCCLGFIGNSTKDSDAFYTCFQTSSCPFGKDVNAFILSISILVFCLIYLLAAGIDFAEGIIQTVITAVVGLINDVANALNAKTIATPTTLAPFTDLLPRPEQLLMAIHSTIVLGAFFAIFAVIFLVIWFIVSKSNQWVQGETAKLRAEIADLDMRAHELHGVMPLTI
jgi:hypothetical protein